MINVLDESCIENKNTNFMFNTCFLENSAIYEIMSKNMVEPEGLQMTSQYGAFALHAGFTHSRACTCYRVRSPAYTRTQTWARMYTRTRAHRKYVIVIAFALHQRFANAPHCYVIRTLHVLLTLCLSISLGICLRT